MADTSTLSGIGGLLQGFESVLVPHLQQNERNAAHKALQDHEAQLQAIRDKVKGDPELLKDPVAAGAYLDTFGLGQGKSKPEDIIHLLTTSSPEKQQREATTKMLMDAVGGAIGGGTDTSSAPTTPAPAAPATTADLLTAGTGTPATAPQPAPAVQVAAPQPQAAPPPQGDYIPAGYPGAGPIGQGAAPAAQPTEPMLHTVQPVVTQTDRPTNKLDALREKGIGLSLRLPGGLAIQLPGYDPKQQEFVKIQRAFKVAQKGGNVTEAIADLSPDGQQAVLTGLAAQHLRTLTSQGVGLPAAIQQTEQVFGITSLPKNLQEAIVKPYIAGQTENVKKSVDLQYLPKEEAIKGQARLDYAQPQAYAAAAGKYAAKLQYDPNDIQLAMKDLQIDPENPQNTDAQRIQDYLAGKGVAKITREARAREGVNPSPGYLSAQAAQEDNAGQLPTAKQILDEQVKQATAVAGGQAAAKRSDLSAQPIPQKDAYRYIDLTTERPVAQSTTQGEAAKGNIRVLSDKQVTQLTQLKQVEGFLNQYERVATEVFSSNNAATNLVRYGKAKLSADPRLTELRSLEPYFTTFARGVMGDVSRLAQQEIQRSYKALAYGDTTSAGFVRADGLKRAIAESRRALGQQRQQLGLPVNPPASARALPLGGGTAAAAAPAQPGQIVIDGIPVQVQERQVP